MMPRSCQYEKKVLPKLSLIRAWKRNNMSNEDICAKLGIGETAFYDYQNKYSEFKEILTRDKELSDAMVENSAYDNAIGFEYIEEQIATQKEVFYNEDGTKIKEVVTPTIVQVRKKKLSDQQAAQWYLKNSLPGKWKDKKEVDVGNANGEPFKLEDVL